MKTQIARLGTLPRLLDDAQVLRCRDGRLVVSREGATHVLSGIEPDDLIPTLQAVDGHRNVDGVVEALSSAYDPDDVRSVLDQLEGTVIDLGRPAGPVPAALGDPRPGGAPGVTAALLVGSFGEELARALERRGC